MERIDEPIQVLAHKVLPEGQLTKAKLAGEVVYVRERLSGMNQVLELAAPPESWSKIAAVIALEDHLKRDVIPATSFTVAWAEAELAT